MKKAYVINFEVNPPRSTLVDSHDVDAYMEEITYHDYDTLKANGIVDISSKNIITVLFDTNKQNEAKELVLNLIRERAIALKASTDLKLNAYRAIYNSLR